MLSPLSVFFFDNQIIVTGKSFLHYTVFIKLPVFVTISSKPLCFLIVVSVLKTKRYTVFTKGPKLFLECVIQLFFSFVFQEFLNRFGTPFGVQSIRQSNSLWVFAIAGIFGYLYFLQSGFHVKWSRRKFLLHKFNFTSYYYFKFK